MLVVSSSERTRIFALNQRLKRTVMRKAALADNETKRDRRCLRCLAIVGVPPHGDPSEFASKAYAELIFIRSRMPSIMRLRTLGLR